MTYASQFGGGSNTDLGGYALFSSNQGNVVTQSDGTTFLKSGVIAPVASYPTVPPAVTAYLNPLALVGSGSIGSGGYWVSITINPDTGYPLVLSDSANGMQTEIRGLSTTSNSDCNVSGYYGAAVSAEATYAYRYKVHLYHKAYVGLGLDTTLTSGSTNNFINYTTVSNVLSGAGAAIVNRSNWMVTSMASNPAGNYIALTAPSSGAATSDYYYGGNFNSATNATLPSSGTWTCCAWGSNVFVALRSGVTNAASSPTGTAWANTTLPSASAWTAVASSGTLFVAVSSGGTVAASSADGTTWIARTLPVSANWSAVTYSNTLGLWCAVASDSAIAATSPDGITWTQRTLPTSAYWADVKWSPALAAFITVAKDGLAGAAYSLNGISWALKLMPNVVYFRQLMEGGTNTFYAIGSYYYNAASTSYASAMPVIAKTIDNGATWKYYKPNIALGTGSSSIGYPDTGFKYLGNRVCCAWATNGTISSPTITFASTADGITWTSGTMSDTVGSQYVSWAADIAYLNTFYIVIANQIGQTFTQRFWYSTSNSSTVFNMTTAGTLTTSPQNLVTANDVMLMYGNNTGGGNVVIWKSAVNSPTSWVSNITTVGQSYTYSSMTYDSVKDIVYLMGYNSGTLYVWSSSDRGTTWSQVPAGLTSINQSIFSTWTNANNGTYASIGSSQVTTGPSVGYMGTTANSLTYTHGYSILNNRASYFANPSYIPTPVPVTQGGINYFTDGTKFLKMDTQKYIDNTQSAGEVNYGTAARTFNYYMRVK